MSIQLELAAFPITIWEANPMQLINQSMPIDATLSIGAIIFIIDFILLEKLNMVTKSSITLFYFSFGELESTVQAVIDRSYNFYLMKYQSRLQISGSPFLESSEIEIDRFDYQSTRKQKIKITFKLKNTFKHTKNEIFLRIGTNFTDAKFGKFSFQNIRLIVKQRSQLQKDHLIKMSENNILQNYDFQDGSFPIKYLFVNHNQISLGQNYFIQLIQSLPPYTAIDTSHKKNQLYICHDMKGGYKEENEYGNPFLKTRQNSYRFNYFHHTSIFNYFSHHTISIPPKHWRQLCKKFQVKCLGTFIVQAGRINQKYYLTQEFAYKLVYIAKKLKFDGYLLNIQDRVIDTKRLNEWLKILTEKIHVQIPGSFIVWYDSIVLDGSIQYQNEVNSLNQIYYNITDHFFTNYWWNQRQIQDDIKQLRLGTQKTIFVGNDVYGRGTYGGGQYELYRAIDLLSSQKKQNIGICLFGQAFDYQNGGRDNNPMFKINQNRLYRGVESQIISLNQWTQKTIPAQGQNIYYKSTIVDLYSQKKRNPLQQAPVQIKFVFKVTIHSNVPSNFIYKYRVYLQIVNTETNSILKQTGALQKDLNLKSININQTLQEKIYINNNLIGPNISLKILIIANNNQTISFEKQKLVVSYYNAKKDWLNKLSISSYRLDQKVNTFFNAGHGPHFYFYGSSIFNKYDYMSDYDILHTHSINHPFQTEILFNEAYIGGSSLQIKAEKINLLKLNITEIQDMQESQKQQLKYIYVKMITKNGNIKKLFVIQRTSQNDDIINEQKLEKVFQKQLQNKWKQIIFVIEIEQIKALQLQTLTHKELEIQTYLSGQFQDETIIGQLMIYPSLQKLIQSTSQQYTEQFIDQDVLYMQNISLTISLSFRTRVTGIIALSLDLNVDSYVLDEQHHMHRYLIQINDNFSGFCYVQNNKCSLREITVPSLEKDVKSIIKVYDVDSRLKINTILEQRLNIGQLNEKQLSHRIKVTNY